MPLPAPLNPTPRLLLGPGPSDAHPSVLRAMTTPLLGHLDPQFLELMNQVQDMLRDVFQTGNALTLPVSATGSAGMEACLVNLLEAGDKSVICSKGYFGQRMVDMSQRLGAKTTVVEQTWGKVFDLNQIREALQRERPKVLGIVHAETSTGAWQPIEELGKLCHETDTMLVVDAVTSLGCVPVKVDEWGIDAVYSCSQKGLGCPPGLAPVSFSPRAVEVMEKRKTKVPNWYLDLSMIRKYLGSDRVYHHTAPISMNYALHEGLRLVLEEGLEARWKRHMTNHRALKAGLLAMGLSYTAQEGHQLPQLNAVRIPAGVDDVAGRKMLLEQFGIEVGGGLGDLKGKAWRIGLMGFGSQMKNVALLLTALESCLHAQQVSTGPKSAGLAAWQAIQGTS